MLNSVIITIKTGCNNIEYDMELPANIQCKQLCEKLLSALININNENFSPFDNLSLVVERTGKQVGDDETLEGAEVWDGSIVNVVKRAVSAL